MSLILLFECGEFVQKLFDFSANQTNLSTKFDF